MACTINIDTCEKFCGLSVSSKFLICGLPIRLDTYKSCSFGCRYCFANSRIVMDTAKSFAVADVDSIKRRLDRVMSGNGNTSSLLDTLIAKRVTWHCGGMSDPFQPINAELRITNKTIDVCNQYGIKILFSTKSDTVHDANLIPSLHTFQLSVSNVDDRKDIEPFVPPIEKRVRFFHELKSMGFKVGIRIQPFIPNVSSTKIVEVFRQADHFTIEGLKLVPQNHAQIKWVRESLGIPLSAFMNKGLYNLDIAARHELYAPVIEKIKKITNATYSISDNDMRKGDCYCCCGDSLVMNGATGIDTTAMRRKYGDSYGIADVQCEIDRIGIGDCVCKNLFASNRQQFGNTVNDFLAAKFRSRSAPCSPVFRPQFIQPTLFPSIKLQPNETCERSME